MSPTPDVKSVFGKAVEIPAAADRAAYLDEACAGHPAVRAEVEALLSALGGAGSFMAAPAAPAADTRPYEPPITEGEGMVIGPYTLREQIGEGGFGLVFVAEQTQPVRRKVALKVIKPGMDSRQVVARFEAERQALALMDHPNIAKVLDAGATDTGRPYFVMELVRGVPITEYADANNLTPRDRLGMFVQVCQAVQHAHQKGVIHRDLKPSNVLVTTIDGAPVPKVIDFGVAKAVGQSLTERTVYTRFAQMVGTPLYMSPEQAELSGVDVDTRADVYSLGVLLYELLTGTTPFDGDRFRKAAFDEIRRIIREEEPPRPSTRLTSLGATLTAVSSRRGTEPGKLAGLIRGELDWIVMRCLEKDRGRRYDTAVGLARDVERYLKNEQVEACPPTLGYRLRKSYRRNRAALSTAAVVAAALLTGTAVSVWQAVRAKDAEASAVAGRTAEAEQRAEADRERQSAVAAREDLRRSHYAATMNLIPAAWKADNVKRVIKLLNEVKPKDGEADLRNFEWHYWDRQCHAERRALALPKDALGPGSQFSDDGTRLVYATRSEPRPPGELVQVERPFSRVKHVVIDTTTGRTLLTTPAVSAPAFTSFSISADGKRLATVGRGAQPGDQSTLTVWDIDTGKSIFEQPVRGYNATDEFTFSPDVTRLAVPETISDPETNRVAGSHIRLWHLTDPNREPLVLEKTDDANRQLTVSFRPDGQRVAVLNARNNRLGNSPNRSSVIRLVNVTTGEVVGKVERPETIRQVTFTPDGKQLVGIGNADSVLRGEDGFRFTVVWDVSGAEPKEVRKTPLPSHLGANPVSSFTLSPDGRRMAIWPATDEPLHVVDVASGELRQTIKPIETPRAAAFTAGGSRVLTVSGLGEGIRGGGNVPLPGSGVRLHEWDLTPEPAPPTKPTVNPVLVWSKDGQRGVEFQRNERNEAGDKVSVNWLRVRDKAGKELSVFKEHTSLPGRVNLSPNGRMVTSTGIGQGKKYYVWEADTGKVRFTGTVELLMNLSISPDGRFLYLPGKEGGSVVRFDDLHELFRVPKDIVAHFSPDSRRLVTISGIRRVSFTPRPMNPNDRPEPEPEPNEKPELTLWNLETGRMIRSEPLPQSPAPFGIVTRVYFSDDGKFFLATNARGRVRTEGSTIAVYDATTGEPKGPRISVGSVSFSPSYAFSPDGSKLVMHSNSNTPLSRIDGAQVYDVLSGKPAFRLEGQVGVVAGLTFSPDGTRIATVAAEGSRSELTLRLWDAATGRGLLSVENVATRLRQLPGRGFASIATKLTFSPDGRTLTLRQPNDGGREVIETWDATPRPEPAK